MVKINTHATFKKVSWKEDLSLQEKRLDTQHQLFFEILNRLIDHQDAKTKSELLNNIIYELLQYIDNHFKYEEDFFKRMNYPKLEEHKQLHHKFSKQLAMFCADMSKQKPNITLELISFLSDWAKEHIQKADLDYKNYL